MAVPPEKLRLTLLRDPLCFRTMKKLLSLLLCYVFLQAETFALRGGPGGSTKLAGAYSGVFTQTGVGSDIGLFLLNATTSGASDGQIVIFSQSPVGSFFYSGTLTGLVSPVSGQFTGIFGATVAQSSTGNALILVITTRSIAGSLTLSVKPGARTGTVQQITGTAVSQQTTTGGIGGTTVGPLTTYAATGWQTSANAVTNGFIVPSGG